MYCNICHRHVLISHHSCCHKLVLHGGTYWPAFGSNRLKGDDILTLHSGNPGHGREQLSSDTLAVAAGPRSTMYHAHLDEKTDSDVFASRLVAYCAPVL
jgi:hypothetical protein